MRRLDILTLRLGLAAFAAWACASSSSEPERSAAGPFGDTPGTQGGAGPEPMGGGGGDVPSEGGGEPVGGGVSESGAGADGARTCRLDRPEGVKIGDRLPSSVLAELVGETPGAASCARPASLVVIALQAGFCGTCQLLAKRLPGLLSESLRERVQRIDVLVAGELNDPAGPRAVERWQRRVGNDVSVSGAPAPELLDAFPPRSGLPLVLVLDARSFEIIRLMSGAWPGEMAAELERELARLDGRTEPEAAPTELVDHRFNDDEWSLVEEMSLSRLELPADPTNLWADDARAAKLGKTLFFDAGFSKNGEVSCGSCHQPARSLSSPDPTPAQGIGPVERNSPSVAFASFSPFQFWDGRLNTLWGQATKPLENPVEMGFTRVQVLHRLAQVYRAEVEPVFGPLPDEETLASLPSTGAPGMEEWRDLTEEQQQSSTRALVVYGKAVAAFERSLQTMPLALDAYVGGRSDALTEAQKDGLEAFLGAGCPQCHFGPRLTDDAFHVLRAPSGREDLTGDRGRLDAVGQLEADPMRASGPWSDAPATEVAEASTLHDGLLGAFKTPALRGVASTAPYGHGGGDASLRRMVDLHRLGGLPPGSALAVGEAERWLTPFSEAERERIVTFLQSLPLTLRAY